MTDAHYHLLVNHLPLLFPLVGVLVLLGGLLVRSAIVKRAAYFVFILGSLATIAAMATGEGAEEVVEHMQGITKQIIHEHEEKAEAFAILSYILGFVSLLALWSNLKKKTFANIISIVVLLLAGVLLFFAQQTGTTGGEIRHTEIRDGYGLHLDLPEHED